MRYRRVPTEDPDVNNNAEEERKRKRAELIDWISNKIHAFFWVSLASIVLYFTDFLHVIFEHPLVDSMFFNLAMICLGLNICIFLYLAIYLPYIKKITLDWNIYCPRVIFTATFSGIFMGIFLIIALWGVWGLLTPFILGSLFMGFVMIWHFVPF